jgi:hypothetical protein
MTIGNDSGDWVATVVPDFDQIFGICTGKDNALVAVGRVSTIDPKTYTTTSIDNGTHMGTSRSDHWYELGYQQYIMERHIIYVYGSECW